jgi:hypothetical protein
MERKRLLQVIREHFPKRAPDLSKRDVYDRFCMRYGEAVRPGLKEVDRLQADSISSAYSKVVR